MYKSAVDRSTFERSAYRVPTRGCQAHKHARFMGRGRKPGDRPNFGESAADLMKIAFDSRPRKDERGIGRYVRCLVEALHARGDVELVETHTPRRCDLFHSPWIEGALLRCPVPMVVTLHDLVALKRRGEYLRTGVRFKLRYLAVQRAARVIVASEALADDAMHMLRIPAERIAVIPEAPAPAFWPRSENQVSAVRERFGLPDHYLVWAGGLRQPDPRKRIAALTRARRNMPLVLVGPSGPWASELPGVHLTGAVGDDDLAAIYTGAHALVFPSDDEGFGLPPIEALACGTPVAACDVPALRETLKDSVQLTDIGDIDGLVATAESLRRPAPAPPAWTWHDAALATREAYSEALAAAAPRRDGGPRLKLRYAGARPVPGTQFPPRP
jgi:glycosyltransferase involved in cell wall biosynthesis